MSKIIFCKIVLYWAKYNHVTTNLAFHDAESYKTAVNSIKLAVYYCHPGVYQTTWKCVRIYSLISFKFLKRKFMVKKSDSLHICCWYTFELPLSNGYQQQVLKKNKEVIEKFKLFKSHAHCICLSTTWHFASHYQNACHYMGRCLYLHDKSNHQLWFQELLFCLPSTFTVVQSNQVNLKPRD